MSQSKDEEQRRSQDKPEKAQPGASRTINVEVPEAVYWHIRKCATQSQLSMKDFMAKFCREAQPYLPRRKRHDRTG